MKNHKFLVSLLTVLLISLFVLPLLAADAQYIGAAKCKMCHKSASRGNQWEKWENGPHTKAFVTLASEQSQKIAKEIGIEDAQKSEKCLKCHVTAFGAPAAKKAATFKIEEGVTCEGCHGPGSLYKSMSVMKGLSAGTHKAADYEFMHGDEATCKTCHNEESPTYKAFSFKERFAEIAHPLPTK